MIAASVAKNGSVVFSSGDRLLASAVEPQREAREWCARRSVMLNEVKIIFVLGAGAGYHLAELLTQTMAGLVVIEHDPLLISAVQDLHGFDPHRVHFELVEKAKQLRAAVHVKAGVAQSFQVLSHPPSVARNPDFYRECQSLLLGRDWASLSWQWRLKGFTPLDAQSKIHGTCEPLTIYDLEQTELVRDSSVRERMLVKALRELVK